MLILLCLVTLSNANIVFHEQTWTVEKQEGLANFYQVNFQKLSSTEWEFRVGLKEAIKQEIKDAKDNEDYTNILQKYYKELGKTTIKELKEIDKTSIGIYDKDYKGEDYYELTPNKKLKTNKDKIDLKDKDKDSFTITLDNGFEAGKILKIGDSTIYYATNTNIIEVNQNTENFWEEIYQADLTNDTWNCMTKQGLNQYWLNCRIYTKGYNHYLGGAQVYLNGTVINSTTIVAIDFINSNTTWGTITNEKVKTCYNGTQLYFPENKTITSGTWYTPLRMLNVDNSTHNFHCMQIMGGAGGLLYFYGVKAWNLQIIGTTTNGIRIGTLVNSEIHNLVAAEAAYAAGKPTNTNFTKIEMLGGSAVGRYQVDGGTVQPYHIEDVYVRNSYRLVELVGEKENDPPSGALKHSIKNIDYGDTITDGFTLNYTIRIGETASKRNDTLTWQSDVDMIFVDANSDPVSGVDVIVTDNLNQTVLTWRTNTTGRIPTTTFDNYRWMAANNSGYFISPTETLTPYLFVITTPASTEYNFTADFDTYQSMTIPIEYRNVTKDLYTTTVYTNEHMLPLAMIVGLIGLAAILTYISFNLNENQKIIKLILLFLAFVVLFTVPFTIYVLSETVDDYALSNVTITADVHYYNSTIINDYGSTSNIFLGLGRVFGWMAIFISMILLLLFIVDLLDFMQNQGTGNIRKKLGV